MQGAPRLDGAVYDSEPYRELRRSPYCESQPSARLQDSMSLSKHGLRVPEPKSSLKNVLVMEFIGTEDAASPRLQDIELEDPMGVFEDLLEIAAIIWQTCDLVHADFSEYNVLWHDGQPWVIDVGQGVTTRHPSAREFLVRDVTRLTEWIGRQGHEVSVAESLVRVLDDPVPELASLPSGD